MDFTAGLASPQRTPPSRHCWPLPGGLALHHRLGVARKSRTVETERQRLDQQATFVSSKRSKKPDARGDAPSQGQSGQRQGTGAAKDASEVAVHIMPNVQISQNDAQAVTTLPHPKARQPGAGVCQHMHLSNCLPNSNAPHVMEHDDDICTPCMCSAGWVLAKLGFSAHPSTSIAREQE